MTQICHKKYQLLGIVLLILFCRVVYSETLSNQDIKQTIFNRAEKMQLVAQEKQADIYAPDSFSKGMELYQNAVKKFNTGKNLKDIQKKLSKAVSYFNKSIDTVKLASLVFKNAIKARNKALKADSSTYTYDSFSKAEKVFKEATRILEKGDNKKAKSKGKVAEKLYLSSELKAIKAKCFQDVWTAFKKLENINAIKYAPLTVSKAYDVAKIADEVLINNRLDTDQATQLAKQAEYEALHAIYLTKAVNLIDQSKKSNEELLIKAEIPIQKIAMSLGITAHFDKGTDAVVQNIINELQQLRKSKMNLEQEVHTIKEHLSLLSSFKEQMKFKMDQEKKWRGKISKIRSLFAQKEGKVIKEDQTIIIRLYGLSFQTGKSIIKPEHYSLLTKIINALSLFPDKKIIIEGHTDSQGGEYINQRLSSERANAVKQYILANTNILHYNIDAIGYGFAHPIASNQTAKGKSKNRRIDVVIQP